MEIRPPAPRQIAAMFGESLHWDRPTLIAYQQSQLAQALDHARRTVPFYRGRLDDLYRADGSPDWSRWAGLPILTRADLRDRAEQLKTTAPIERHGPWQDKSSSGSTGVPITVTFTRFFLETSAYGWQRFHAIHGIDFGKGVNRYKADLPREAAPGAIFHLRDGSDGRRPKLVILRTLPVPRKLELLCHSPFRHLTAFANHVEILARENLRQCKPVTLAGLECYGSAVTAEQQALFVESFGTRAISPYSSTEGALMAFQCPHGHDHYHVCAESVLLEILDENGREVAPGKQGRAVITPFFNTAQPLIRYEQGDLLVRGKGCPGGITLPAVQAIAGRSDVNFKFAGQEVALLGLQVLKLREHLGADAFQIAQTGAMALEVRYLSAGEAREADRQAVSGELRKFIPAAVTIAFRRVDDIPMNAGGKQQRYVREC